MELMYLMNANSVSCTMFVLIMVAIILLWFLIASPTVLDSVLLPFIYIGDLVCTWCLFVQILKSSSYGSSLLNMPFSPTLNFILVGKCCLFIFLWLNFTNNSTLGKLARKHPDLLKWSALCLCSWWFYHLSSHLFLRDTKETENSVILFAGVPAATPGTLQVSTYVCWIKLHF